MTDYTSLTSHVWTRVICNADSFANKTSLSYLFSHQIMSSDISSSSRIFFLLFIPVAVWFILSVLFSSETESCGALPRALLWEVELCYVFYQRYVILLKAGHKSGSFSSCVCVSFYFFNQSPIIICVQRASCKCSNIFFLHFKIKCVKCVKKCNVITCQSFSMSFLGIFGMKPTFI